MSWLSITKCQAGRNLEGAGVGTPKASVTLRKEKLDMTKTLDVISETIRNSKHPFRKAEDRPKKAQKHRYERRKIKEYLHLGDWLTQESA
jgi:hypothetical protein